MNDILLSQVKEALTAEVYLTIDVIEAIVEWRERLNYLLSKIQDPSGLDKHDFVFQWENENYLIKIKNDTMFLKDSILSKFFHFSSKADPFLLVPSQMSSNMVSGPPKTKKKAKKCRKIKTKDI